MITLLWLARHFGSSRLITLPVCRSNHYTCLNALLSSLFTNCTWFLAVTAFLILMHCTTSPLCTACHAFQLCRSYMTSARRCFMPSGSSPRMLQAYDLVISRRFEYVMFFWVMASCGQMMAERPSLATSSVAYRVGYSLMLVPLSIHQHVPPLASSAVLQAA